ncbi:MAG: hypothetical protein M3R36_07070 [Bacteroidota bacterium]|nr:hypothetical protein [Bacteroidota bacterium]
MLFARIRFILFIFLFIITSDCFSFYRPFYLPDSKNFSPADTSRFNDGTDPSQPISRIDLQNNFFWDWFELTNDRYYNVSQLNGGKTFYNGHLYFYFT